jgi:hypothetical protein
VTDGSLPSGLTLATNGVLAGFPTNAGSFHAANRHPGPSHTLQQQSHPGTLRQKTENKLDVS